MLREMRDYYIMKNKIINFEIYKSYKQKLSKVEIKEIGNLRIENILALSIWSLNRSNSFKLFVFNICNIFKLCFFDLKKIIYNKKNTSSMLFINVDRERKDYQDIYNKVKNTLSEPQYSEIIVSDKKCFNIKKVVNFIYIIKFTVKLKEIHKFGEKLYFAVNLVRYKAIYDFLVQNIDREYKFVVTFCDAQPYENIAAQYFNIKGVETATLQHGYYLVKDDPDINCVVYDNFISDYLFCWGDFTIDEFKRVGIDRRRLINLGSPKYIDFEFKKVNDVIGRKTKKIFGVALEGPSLLGYAEYNRELIMFANFLSHRIGYKYIIKRHPSDRQEYDSCYKDKSFIGFDDSNIYEYIELVDFSIVFFSSVYFELNSLLSPVFRYVGDINLKFGNNDFDTFKDKDELLYRYNIYTKNHEKWILNEYENGVYFMNKNEVASNYRDFFDNMLK